MPALRLYDQARCTSVTIISTLIWNRKQLHKFIWHEPSQEAEPTELKLQPCIYPGAVFTTEKCVVTWSENLTERDPLVGLGVAGRIVKWIVHKSAARAWTGFVSVSSEHGMIFTIYVLFNGFVSKPMAFMFHCHKLLSFVSLGDTIPQFA